MITDDHKHIKTIVIDDEPVVLDVVVREVLKVQG